MATYYVKTNASYPALASVGGKPTSPFSRSLIIEADRFNSNENTGTYDFFTQEKLVASVPGRDVLAVLEEDAYQGDYLFDLADDSLDEEDDETDDVCTDCVVKDILECELFRDGVADMVAAITEAEYPEPEPPAEEFPIEHWKKDGEEWWGIQTSTGFVHFNTEEDAKECRKDVLDDPYGEWAHLDLTGYTKVED